MMKLSVVRRPLEHADVRPLLDALDRELAEVNPDGGTNFTSLASHEVIDGHGAFFVVYGDGRPVGCGAYRPVPDERGVAEVKRMWSDPSLRGSGVGHAVMRAIIDGARTDGYHELRLETGLHLEGAMRLYLRHGFRECAPWGEYVGVPLSHCMSLRLDGPGHE